jgi:hypothetical protein
MYRYVKSNNTPDKQNLILTAFVERSSVNTNDIVLL